MIIKVACFNMRLDIRGGSALGERTAREVAACVGDAFEVPATLMPPMVAVAIEGAGTPRVSGLVLCS